MEYPNEESSYVLLNQTPSDGKNPLADIGRELYNTSRLNQSAHQGIEGHDIFLRSALGALASALEAAALIAKELEQRKYLERANKALINLMNLDERINAFPLAEALASEVGAKEENELQATGTPKPIQKQQSKVQPPEPPPSQTIETRFNDIFQQFDQQLDALEMGAGINNDRPALINIEPNLPFPDRLNRIEQAIEILTERVVALEQFHSKEQAVEAEEDKAIARTCIEISQTLNQKAEGAFNSKIGKVEISAPQEDTVIVSIQDKDNDEPKFRAIHTNNEWTVDRNDLTDVEKQRIFEWPQELKAHQSSATKAFISELKQSYPDSFNQADSSEMWALNLPEGGKVEGYAEDHKTAYYKMTTHLNDDQSRELILEEQLLDREGNQSEGLLWSLGDNAKLKA